MTYIPSEPFWTPVDVKNYWEGKYGELSNDWKRKFATDPFVIQMTTFHPYLIREAINRFKRTQDALRYIKDFENKRIISHEELLNDFFPPHGDGITNAHHGVRTTDPFDTQNEKLTFICTICHFKLSNAQRTEKLENSPICLDCAEKLR